MLSKAVVAFAIILFMALSPFVATAAPVDVSLSGLTGNYQLGQEPDFNPYELKQTTALGSPYTAITAFSRTVTGIFTLPKYIDAQGKIVDGYIDAREWVRDVSNGYPHFNYLFVDNLQSIGSHSVNAGITYDFTPTQIASGTYSFVMSDTMSNQADPNWIAGITSGNLFTSMYFDNYGLNGYTFVSSGSVQITGATVHFEDAATPTPVPPSIFLLSGGCILLFLHRRRSIKLSHNSII
jgi:hypothetical protein